MLARKTNETIEADITDSWSSISVRAPGLTDVIMGRSVRGQQGLSPLANNDRRVIAGSLDSVAPVQSAGLALWIRTSVASAASSELRRARGRYSPAQGFHLLWRDVHEQRELSLFTTILLWARIDGRAGIAGGIMISRNFLSRLDVINRTIRQIMRAISSQRDRQPGRRRFDVLPPSQRMLADRALRTDR